MIPLAPRGYGMLSLDDDWPDSMQPLGNCTTPLSGSIASFPGAVTWSTCAGGLGINALAQQLNAMQAQQQYRPQFEAAPPPAGDVFRRRVKMVLLKRRERRWKIVTFAGCFGMASVGPAAVMLKSGDLLLGAAVLSLALASLIVTIWANLRVMRTIDEIGALAYRTEALIFSDSDKVRFMPGRISKIGGWSVHATPGHRTPASQARP